MEPYILNEIETESKYGWQEAIKLKEEYNKDNCGLSCIYSRTGSGKTRAQYERMKYYKSIGKTSVSIYCPFKTRNYLPSQICKEFKNLLNKENVSYRTEKEEGIFKYTIIIGNFKCKIETLPNYRKSIYTLLHKHDLMNPIIIDEFDDVQTQLGLNHGGSLDNYASSKLKSQVKVFEKTGNNLLERLCKLTHVNGYTASFDEILTSDLLPYRGKFPITVYLVKHKKDILEPVNIKNTDEKTMKDIILKNYDNKKRSIAFVSNKNELRELTGFLRDNKVRYYSWCSGTDNKLDTSKIKDNLISIFVTGPTRGLNIPSIENIFIFRALAASTKQNKSSMSALCNQIAGRIRKQGTIYRDVSVLSRDQIYENRFDYEEQNIKMVFSDETRYDNDFFEALNKRKQYNNDYKNNMVRLYLYRFLSKYADKSNNKRGNSITQILRDTLNNDYDELNSLCQEIQVNLKTKVINDELLTKYIQCEDQLMEIFVKAFNILLPGYEHIFKPNKSINTNSNSTGGGTAKPNISESEKLKSLEAAKKATSMYGGTSFIVMIKGRSHDDFKGFMHAKPKAHLDNKERTKCIYAIPMFSDTETGINATDTNTELLHFHGTSKPMTINYEHLKKHELFDLGIFRPEKEINHILEIYHKEVSNKSSSLRDQPAEDNKKRHQSGFAKPALISNELCSFLNVPQGTEMARTEVTKFLTSYIKEHDLQDPENRRRILPDKKLQKLLNTTSKDEVSYFNLYRYMKVHFPP